MTLTLTKEVYDHLASHARDGAPEEVCGVLGGTHDEDSVASVARRVANVAEHPLNRYELDPAEQMLAMDDIEESGLDVVGFYHSHPRGPDRPSGVDTRLATWPGYSYVIVSLAGGETPEVGSWRWRDESGFERERVVVRSV